MNLHKSLGWADKRTCNLRNNSSYTIQIHPEIISDCNMHVFVCMLHTKKGDL